MAAPLRSAGPVDRRAHGRGPRRRSHGVAVPPSAMRRRKRRTAVPRQGKRRLACGMALHQRLRFCTSFDGTRLAIASIGKGPPLVRAAHWLSHVEHDAESPVWRPWLEELGRAHTYVRYDQRNCGLSDRDVADLSLDAWVADLEAVVETLGLERFAL